MNFSNITNRAGKRHIFPPTEGTLLAVPPISKLQAFWCELPRSLPAEHVFDKLFAQQPSAYWLDGALVAPSLSRWSYLGDASGPKGALLEYDLASQRIDVRDAQGHHLVHEDIFKYLNEACRAAPLVATPCPFTGGYVGWFGYELRPSGLPLSSHKALTPDALFVRSDRFVAIDHLESRTYLVAIDDEDKQARAESWLAETALQLAQTVPMTVGIVPAQNGTVEFRLDRDEITYQSDIRRCLDWIADGKTYQVCLTNQMTCSAQGDPLDLYLILRRVNPAPYAAFLKWPGGAVLSASPERFMQVDQEGNIETKPIKGTARRAANPVDDAALAEQLRTSEKDRAENVMIVDLMRNDLSRVCEIGSVVVPKLFAIESFATVHQLVSTIQGKLRAECGVIDLLQATFPGGSMTGAPKAKTLELIDELEGRARGVYSGALGWIGNDGAADLSIVIRTIVQIRSVLTFGIGGGVVADSTPDGEFAEILLKAQALMNTIRLAAAGDTDTVRCAR